MDARKQAARTGVRWRTEVEDGTTSTIGEPVTLATAVAAEIASAISASRVVETGVVAQTRSEEVVVEVAVAVLAAAAHEQAARVAPPAWVAAVAEVSEEAGGAGKDAIIRRRL